MGDIYASAGVSNYPTSLDTATPQTDDPPSVAFATTSSHSSKINNLATAIIALETKVNTTAASGTSGQVLFANSSGNFIQNANVVIDTTNGFLQISSPASTAGAAAGEPVIANAKAINASNAAGSAAREMIRMTSANRVIVGSDGDPIQLGEAIVALGGGAAPTLGTIGGSGPATAAQNSWHRVYDSTGTAGYIPMWR